MRKKIISLVLGLMAASSFTACDPFLDSYVPGEIRKLCFEEADGSEEYYYRCVEGNGCKIQPDPMPFSNTPVYICPAAKND